MFDPWLVGKEKKLVSGNISEEGRVEPLTYRKLVEFLEKNPHYLDNPIQFHDDKNGIWSCAKHLRYDSEELEVLVLEGNEEHYSTFIDQYTAKKKLDLKEVSTVRVRLEGESNQFWTVKMKNGAEHKFYALEGSPEYEGGPLADERVHRHDPDLSQFLEEVSRISIPLVTQPEHSVVEFSYDPHSGLVHEISMEVGQLNQDGLDFTGIMTNYPNQYVIKLGFTSR